MISGANQLNTIDIAEAQRHKKSHKAIHINIQRKDNIITGVETGELAGYGVSNDAELGSFEGALVAELAIGLGNGHRGC